MPSRAGKKEVIADEQLRPPAKCSAHSVRGRVPRAGLSRDRDSRARNPSIGRQFSRRVTTTMTENRRPSAPWLALAVLALGLFMTLLDLTIVNVAIPSIVDDLHASLDQILWVLNGYSLAYAVLLITSGRLGDIFGPRNMFAAGGVLFSGASAFRWLSPDPAPPVLPPGLPGIAAAVIPPPGPPLTSSHLST